jgi:hypothetical protein
MKKHFKRIVLIALSLTVIFQIITYFFFKSHGIEKGFDFNETLMFFAWYILITSIGYLLFLGLRWVLRDMQKLPKKD